MENRKPTFKVFIAKGENAYSTTRDVLKRIDLDIEKLKNKRILLKPNSGRLVSERLGINTNPDVVAAVIDFFLESGIKDLAIGESPILGVKALEALEKCGIARVATERKIPLIDLDNHGSLIVKIPHKKIIDHLKICQKIKEFDFIVSIPVMKTHMHTQVSLGLKNMKGCLFKREKVKLHQLPFSRTIPPPAKPLDMAIADMSKVLMPDLTVIDGSIGQEGLGPSAGQARFVGLIIASRHCLAADWIASRLMGLNPRSIHHLQLAIKETGQDINDDTLLPEPKDFLKWKVIFKRPPEKISLQFKNVIVEDKDACSACLSSTLMFLQRYYKDFADYLTPQFPLRMAVGKGIGKQTEDTLLIGNCTIKQKDKGIFIKGCPPVASQIKLGLDKLIKKKSDL
ncbi:MAG: DUF362 domain-containing protein [Spirochaetes bacterium]|nr:DUF362 domain-containing protein [Spirochaetota bacterium]